MKIWPFKIPHNCWQSKATYEVKSEDPERALSCCVKNIFTLFVLLLLLLVCSYVSYLSLSCQHALKWDEGLLHLSHSLAVYLVVMFCRMAIWVLGWTILCCDTTSPPPPPHQPNTVLWGPPLEAVCPAPRRTKLGDTAVKQNLCISLSPGCQGWTSGMSLGDKGWLVAWFLHILTFVRFHVLHGNSWHSAGFGYHKGSSGSSFRQNTQRMLFKHVKFLSQSDKQEWLDKNINSLSLIGQYFTHINEISAVMLLFRGISCFDSCLHLLKIPSA